jgi:sugar phosphate isomerase/epimerase
MDGQEVSRGDQMKTSIATMSISGHLREKRATIAAAAFDGVEIVENDFLAFGGSPADVGCDHEGRVASLRRIMMEAAERP